ncbi:MAG TPA: YbhN family protein [Streptosporangiaceae bacterium]|nr:YbhN family protein [Streptosporangiaceae bacterium]
MTGHPGASRREILPVADYVGGVPLGRAPAQLPDNGSTISKQNQSAAPTGRFRRRRNIAGTAASAVLVAAIFGFALPHVASYRSVWTIVQVMTWPQVLLVVIAAMASLAAGWLLICAVLPSVRLREAAVVNLASTAVASTLPAGGAVAIGISWTMFSSWGVGAADFVLYSLVSGIWNVFARLGLPVAAVLIIMTVSRPDAGLLAAAVAGLVLLGLVAVGFGLILRSDSFSTRAETALRRPLTIACKLARRPLPAGSLQGFRERVSALLAARGWRISAATAACSVTLWLVLLASVRGVGLSQSQVPWQTCLAAFAFVRLLTILPITPGGVGITELGLVGILAAGADHRVAARVTAAVLLYRAVTYVAPIPSGALAWVAWRYTSVLSRGGSRSWTTAGQEHGDAIGGRADCGQAAAERPQTLR